MKRALLTLGITAFVFFAVNAQISPISSSKSNSNPNAPNLTFEKTVHDYGTIANGSDGACEFKFKNTGKEPLIISNCQASCGCTVPVCPKEPILPGKSGTIKITYATTRTGKINKNVTVTSNAKNSPLTLTITGEVLAPSKEVIPDKTINNGATPVNPQNH
jgi:hypothetical protein